MKLNAKILSLSLIPVILLGVSMFLVAADRIANGIYDEAYLGMHATTLAVRDIFEIGYEGAYRLDEKGDLWKGEELNISQSIDIVDHIKENTGLDVTIFWNDTRVLTSITDENGNRQVGTKASEEVAQSVLAEGNSYQNRHVEQACGNIGKRICCILCPLLSRWDGGCGRDDFSGYTAGFCFSDY